MTRLFTWDETKRLKTLEKHGLDFLDVISIFAADHLIIPARSDAEDRFAAIADWNGIMVAVFFTIRGDTTRIITARRARRHERNLYQTLYTRRDQENGIPH
ncbi:BrnT family toxin [Roseinatronobacter thiooxidans]|uniref:BrnT family toxin n=1 Tax=Roseinatronobacter thiooxidans TaxID=121821 RepID=UPI0008F80680|nr:BrnT family toxin [Roseinatronobacter thiooxidans]